MAEKKFGRNYSLDIQTQDGSTLTIAPPFTVEFDITRNILSSANVSSIRVYNLNANHRSQIRKNITDLGDLRLIQLKAGYGDNIPIVFSGNITQAWSVREGTNFISQIESFDGGFAFINSITDVSFPANTAQQTVIETLVQNLSAAGVQMGAIGTFDGSLSRGNAYSGNTTDLLRQLTSGRFFIDNGKAYALSDNECLSGPLTLINTASGLLGTPVREQSIINFDMLFEPRLKLAQRVELQSGNAEETIRQNFNGIYKVVSIKHRGMISESVGGDAITSVGLLQPLGSQTLTVVGE